MRQSTNHLLMIEPAEFFTNPETQETNVYQAVKDDVPRNVISERAIKEFRNYRDILVEHGVCVTSFKGRIGSPDMVFPNWASVYDDGRMILYPMLSQNRQKERQSEIIEILKKSYSHLIDWSCFEKEGKFLESTASIVSDHVNKRAYAALSARTNPELVEKWAHIMGYRVEIFDTASHTGLPVYHTDYLMYIGTKMAGLCTPCIAKGAGEKILAMLSKTHHVIEFTMEQLKANCANALEVIGRNGELMLTMSSSAYDALDGEQRDTIARYYKTVIHSPLPTLEKYGGGSARCMLMELF